MLNPFFFFFWVNSFFSFFSPSSFPPFFSFSFFFFFFLLDKDMQVELARQHQQHQQRSHSNSNHYMNVSIPYSVPQSTTSNYHLVSDLNGNNGNNAESTDIHSDSASSSAASSFVHLPLAGVGANTGVDSLSVGSLLVGGGYDNVSFFSFLGAHFFSPLGSSIVIYGTEKVSCVLRSLERERLDDSRAFSRQDFFVSRKCHLFPNSH